VTDDDDSVPISVRLGTVVPPEDPEDWTRPLTWMAALGMLAAPITALLWFWLAPPRDAGELLPGTILVAAVLVIGAVATGATQMGGVRAFAGTLGAALFAALVTVIVGAAMAGERQVGAASPTLAHAVIGALSGLAGALTASIVAPALGEMRSRIPRMAAPGGIGLAVAVVVARLLA
jgi:hypothetical protein